MKKLTFVFLIGALCCSASNSYADRREHESEGILEIFEEAVVGSMIRPNYGYYQPQPYYPQQPIYYPQQQYYMPPPPQPYYYPQQYPSYQQQP